MGRGYLLDNKLDIRGHTAIQADKIMEMGETYQF